MLRKLLIVSFVFVILATTVLGEILGQFNASLGFDNAKYGLDTGRIPAAVIAEAANPTMTNQFSGTVFDKTRIGTYDPANYSRQGHPIDWKLRTGADLGFDIASKADQSVYLRVNVCLGQQYSSINGSYGEDYAYAKAVGAGLAPVDNVRYVYGVKMRQNLLRPEVGYRWVQEYSEDVDGRIYVKKGQELGLEYRELNAYYYKGMEAFGSTKNPTLLGKSSQHILMLRGKYYFDRFGVDVAVPISNGKGFRLMITGPATFVY